MKRKRDVYIDILILSTLGLIPLLWFREGYGAVAGFDFSVYLNPVATLKKALYLWSDTMAGGYDSSHEVSSMAYYLFFSIPVLLGASLYTAEKIVFSSLFALQGISMYYMMGALFQNQSGARAARLAGAFLYAFSFPVMAHFGRGNLMALLAYALLPFLLGLLKKGFDDQSRRWRYIFILSLLAFPLASVKGHPADFLVLFLVTAFFIFFQVATSGRKEISRILSFTTLASIAFVMVSLWWTVPNLLYLADFGLSAGDLVNEGFYNADILSYYSSGTSLLKAFRNESLDLWFDIPSGILFNTGLYQSSLFILIGLFIPATAFFALLRPRADRNIVFLSIVGLGALFMFKGNHAPFGWVFERLYMDFPGFFLFRAPYRIFSSLVAFSIAPLCALVLAAGLSFLREDGASRPQSSWPETGYERWSMGHGASKRLFIRVISAFFVFTAALYAWPVFTGAHMRERGNSREPGVFQNIPQSYYAAAAWVNRLEGDSKVYFPYEIYDTNTRWGYNGPDPLFELIEAPKVVSRPGGTVYIRYQRPVEAVNRLVRTWEYGDLKAVLGLHGARYILLHDDINRWVLPDYNFNEYVESLFASYGIEKKKEFGPVKIYENNAAVERLYAARKAYLYSGDESGFPDLSVAGLLDRPFFVKTADVSSVDEAKGLIGRSAGLILHESTLTDAVIGLLSKSHPAEYKDGKLRFSANESGEYHVYMRDMKGPNSLAIEKTGSAYAVSAGDTFVWKRLSTIHAGKGEDGVAALWYFNSSNPGAVRFAVVPVPAFEAIKEHIARRVDNEGFDLVFISGKGKKDEPGRQSILEDLEDKGYELTRYMPERYSRAVANGLDRALSWETSLDGVMGKGVQGGNLTTSAGPSILRAKIRLPDIDAGQYPLLVFDKDFPDSEGGGFSLKAEMVFFDENGSKEILVITDKTIRSGGGSVDIMKALTKNASTAIVHKLREVSLTVTLKNPGAPGVKLSIPRLEGAFGVEEEPCGSPQGKGLSSDGSGTDGTDAVQCGKGAVEEAQEAADRGLGADDNRRAPVISLARKKDLARQQGIRSLEFFKESPARYRVRVDGEGPAQIVFSESFDPDWVMRSSAGKVKPVMVNGYANGFFLDLSGPQEYTLEYAPQRFYRLSGLTSAVSLAAVAFMAVAEVARARASSRKEGEHEG